MERKSLKDKSHVSYFDYLRVMAAICIIYMHTAVGPLRSGINTDWQFINLLTCFSFTAVPLFFMMSGYLILSSQKTADISVLLKKRLPKLLVPLIGWTVVALLWNLYANHQLTPAAFYNGLVGALQTPVAVHFWYMYTLIVLYAISPFLYGAIHSLDRRGHRYLLVLIGLVTLRSAVADFLPAKLQVYTSIDFIDKLQIFSGHLCTFLLGYYLGSLQKKLSSGKLLACIAALLAVITCGTWYLTVKTGTFDQTFQNQSAGLEVLLAACIFLLFKQNCDRPSRFLARVPLVPLALPIYMMHNILLNMFLCVGIFPVGFLGTLYVTLLNLDICFFVMKTVTTIKPLCYLSSGMSYADACKSCNWVYTVRWIRAARNRKKNEA